MIEDDQGGEREYDWSLVISNFTAVAEVEESQSEVEITVEAPIEQSNDTPNCSARIAKISVFGEMEILFNATMFTDFDFRFMNSSYLDVYVQPSP